FSSGSCCLWLMCERHTNEPVSVDASWDACQRSKNFRSVIGDSLQSDLKFENRVSVGTPLTKATQIADLQSVKGTRNVGTSRCRADRRSAIRPADRPRCNKNKKAPRTCGAEAAESDLLQPIKRLLENFPVLQAFDFFQRGLVDAGFLLVL